MIKNEDKRWRMKQKYSLDWTGGGPCWYWQRLENINWSFIYKRCLPFDKKKYFLRPQLNVWCACTENHTTWWRVSNETIQRKFLSRGCDHGSRHQRNLSFINVNKQIRLFIFVRPVTRQLSFHSATPHKGMSSDLLLCKVLSLLITSFTTKNNHSFRNLYCFMSYLLIWNHLVITNW